MADIMYTIVSVDGQGEIKIGGEGISRKEERIVTWRP